MSDKPNRWWITTRPLPEGRKILGPFESQELALKVRCMDCDCRTSVADEVLGGENPWANR